MNRGKRQGHFSTNLSVTALPVFSSFMFYRTLNFSSLSLTLVLAKDSGTFPALSVYSHTVLTPVLIWPHPVPNSANKQPDLTIYWFCWWLCNYQVVSWGRGWMTSSYNPWGLIECRAEIDKFPGQDAGAHISGRGRNSQCWSLDEGWG